MKNRPSKLYPFLLLSILVHMVACQNHTTATKTNQSDTTKHKGNGAAKTLSCDTIIVSQEFSYGALAFKVFKADTNKIKSLFLDPVVLKMQKRIGDSDTPYYVHNFSDGVNQISLLYHSNEGFYIEDADIKNDMVRLNKKIAIGMQKEALLKLLKASNIKCDTITVQDDEASFESVYIFKDNKLAEIKMGQIVE